MNFTELLSKLRKKPLQEVRAHSDNYFEAVVSATELVKVEDDLMAHFGIPMKPAGVASSSDAARCSKVYGGVRRNQTMYFREKEVGHEVAFLWPWGCGTLVTLKVILEDKPAASSLASGAFSLKSLWKKLWNR